MRRLSLDRLYAITSAVNRLGLDHVGLAEAYLKGGCRLLQVRDKNLSDRKLFEQLVEIRRLTRVRGATLIVNDRLDLALTVEADGVHLGWDDLPVDAVRKHFRQGIVGISTHDEDQFRAAQEQEVDYVALGPIFTSRTKPGENPEVGLERLERLAKWSRHPVVAIGGIDLSRVVDVWRAGATSAAVVSDLADAADPTRRVREYLKAAQETTS